MTRVLFVCLGNICRSPTAEAVLRRMAPELHIDSAGTGDWHIGKPPYGPAIDAAQGRGYDLTALRARQFQPEDFSEFDLIVAMDRANKAAIETLRPQGSETPVRLMLDFAPKAGLSDVPDPYFTGGFDETLDLIETASRGLLASLQP